MCSDHSRTNESCGDPTVSKNNTAKLPGRSGGDSTRQILVGISVAVVLLALIGAIGYGVWTQKQHKDQAKAGPAAFSNGAIVFGNTGSKVVLNLKEDFQCPACKAFETASGDFITGVINSGKVRVEYDPIAILDKNSTTNYSSRAANASACVVAADKSKWLAFHKLMYDNQPEEGSAGLPDSQLIAFAKQAGVPDVSDCVNSNKYADFVKANTDKAISDGLDHTPTITVNGTQVSDPSPNGLQAAIAKALADNK